MGKEEKVEPTLADVLKRLAELEEKGAAKDREISVLKAEKDKYARTEGRQPIDDMIDAPVREPQVSKLPNGTRRVDF